MATLRFFHEKGLHVFWRLSLLFVGLPMLELFILYLMMNFFGILGTILTVLLFFVTSLFGAGLIRYQGIRCWTELHRQLDYGEMPTQSMIDATLILLAGALLITPGLITDLVGILLLFPTVRRMVFGYFLYRFEMYRLKPRQRSKAPPPDEIIDI